MASVRVWDPWLRTAHVLFLVSFLGAFSSAEWHLLPMDWHFRFGYLVLGTLLFRLQWGFVGGEHARFARFLRGPAAVIVYARGLLSGRGNASVGHSALGGWATLILLGALCWQVGTGLFSNDEISWFGPLSEKISYELSETITDLHKDFSTLLLALVGIHVVAVLLYLLVKRENLITPIITGNKKLEGVAHAAAPAWWVGPLCALISVGATYGLTQLL